MLLLFIVLGLIFGSFGSVLITRIHDFSREALKSIAVGRSECPRCHTTLSRYELIPLLSRIKQKGKCTHCGQKISTFYPAMEILSACSFVLSYFFLASINNTQPLYMIIFTIIIWLLTMLAIYDRRTQTLHLRLWIDTTILSFIFLLLYYPRIQTLWLALIFGIVFSVIYLAAKRYAKRVYNEDEGFGLGDVMLAPIMGGLSAMIFVHQSLEYSTINMVIYICYYLIIASLVTLILLGIKKIFIGNKHLSSSTDETETGERGIAFIPGMVIAFIVMLRYGSQIISFAL